MISVSIGNILFDLESTSVWHMNPTSLYVTQNFRPASMAKSPRRSQVLKYPRLDLQPLTYGGIHKLRGQKFVCIFEPLPGPPCSHFS